MYVVVRGLTEVGLTPARRDVDPDHPGRAGGAGAGRDQNGRRRLLLLRHHQHRRQHAAAGRPRQAGLQTRRTQRGRCAQRLEEGQFIGAARLDSELRRFKLRGSLIRHISLLIGGGCM